MSVAGARGQIVMEALFGFGCRTVSHALVQHPFVHICILEVWKERDRETEREGEAQRARQLEQ